MLKRIKGLAKFANPVKAFDSRRGLSYRRYFLGQKLPLPALMGQPAADADEDNAAGGDQRAGTLRAGGRRGKNLGVAISLGMFPGRKMRQDKLGIGSDSGQELDEHEELLAAERRRRRKRFGANRDPAQEQEMELAAVRELARLDLELELDLGDEDYKASGSRSGMDVLRSSRSRSSRQGSSTSTLQSNRARARKSSRKRGSKSRGQRSSQAVTAKDDEEEEEELPPDPQLDMIFHQPRRPDASQGQGRTSTRPGGATQQPQARPAPLDKPAGPQGLPVSMGPPSPRHHGEAKAPRTEKGVPDFVGYALHLARKGPGEGEEAAETESSDSSDSSGEDDKQEGECGDSGRGRGHGQGKASVTADDVAWERYLAGGCGSSDDSEAAASQDTLDKQGLDEDDLDDLFHAPLPPPPEPLEVGFFAM